ncbi:MjaI family restriction endonuclease [Archaeoglobus veneficus]|uniref:Type II site-specific deoxyribonuclease n=1 Tax=Archaeoglobus veneficus (strain DSM 11195 / SNP6) TaxID=693661 RepID=F2KTA7_ARCVS|nr:MjaI family restriction endonuclease [Archaeoglobus veneficus]AEA47137.1 Type II site-specific deoxyribonuclease [Archaeoglobus veneficus SNP6]
MTKTKEAKEKGRIEISYEEVRTLLDLPQEPKLPKYASLLINLANRFSHGTRPKTVGQMTELIKEFKKDGGWTYEEWKDWYTRKYPNTIKLATNKVHNMLENFKKVLDELDEEIVRRWVEDLVLIKTYEGLVLQEAILKKVAEELNSTYRLATPDEESKGIDGVLIIDNKEVPVSIKPKTYLDQEQHLTEELKGHLIVYKKVKDKKKIVIDYSRLLR